MDDARRLAELAALAALLRDRALADLGRRSAGLARHEAELAARPPPPVLDGDAAVPASVGLLHQRWVMARRAALLGAIARGRAETAAARTDAARSFGRATVLDGLAAEAARRASARRQRRGEGSSGS